MERFVEAARSYFRGGSDIAIINAAIPAKGVTRMSPEDPRDAVAVQQAEEINKERMLRAEDIAVAVRFVLTQPRRAVVQQVTVAPRAQEEE